MATINDRLSFVTIYMRVYILYVAIRLRDRVSEFGRNVRLMARITVRIIFQRKNSRKQHSGKFCNSCRYQRNRIFFEIVRSRTFIVDSSRNQLIDIGYR